MLVATDRLPLGPVCASSLFFFEKFCAIVFGLASKLSPWAGHHSQQALESTEKLSKYGDRKSVV